MYVARLMYVVLHMHVARLKVWGRQLKSHLKRVTTEPITDGTLPIDTLPCN